MFQTCVSNQNVQKKGNIITFLNFLKKLKWFKTLNTDI